MEEEVKNYIIIIALDNLINSYSIALEEAGITPQERDFMQRVVASASQLLDQMYNPKISKPKWKKT